MLTAQFAAQAAPAPAQKPTRVPPSEIVINNPQTGPVHAGPGPVLPQQSKLRHAPQFFSFNALTNIRPDDPSDPSNPSNPSGETAPAGHRQYAPDKIAASGLTFIEDPYTVTPQQNPTWSNSAEPIFDASGNVTGISVNGVKQDYSTQIPYWCANDSTSSRLCYRKTDLFQDQAQSLAEGFKLSVINGAPHIILDDSMATGSLAPFRTLLPVRCGPGTFCWGRTSSSSHPKRPLTRRALQERC